MIIVIVSIRLIIFNKSQSSHHNKQGFMILKFGDGDGPNLRRVIKVDVSSTFIENGFRSGMTLVSS